MDILDIPLDILRFRTIHIEAFRLLGLKTIRDLVNVDSWTLGRACTIVGWDRGVDIDTMDKSMLWFYEINNILKGLGLDPIEMGAYRPVDLILKWDDESWFSIRRVWPVWYKADEEFNTQPYNFKDETLYDDEGKPCYIIDGKSIYMPQKSYGYGLVKFIFDHTEDELRLYSHLSYQKILMLINRRKFVRRIKETHDEVDCPFGNI